jgi:hypothetical protein
MKKWIVWLLVILILTGSCIYLLIPAKIVISRITTAEATITGVYRYMSQEEKWEKWWHDSDGKPPAKGNLFMYDGTAFRLTKQMNNVVGIEIKQKGEILSSVLHLVSFKKDSIGIVWEVEMQAGNNPLSRFMKYRTAVDLGKNMNGVLKNFTSFVSDPKNVYGVSIHRTSTRDTTMLTASFTSVDYPTTNEIYKYFEVLENSILKQQGKASGFPMLNVRQLENGSYMTQVAIPTNRLLENDGNILYRRMVPGNFMVGEVTGGPFTISETMRQLDFFVSDYHKEVMAKPFQVLVTNRLKETDTAKWVTRIYVPVAE